jgi:hypothetical protein
LAFVFNGSADQDAVEAVLRNLTYENTSSTPSTLPRTLQASLELPDGLPSLPSTVTVAVEGIPETPTLRWPAPEDIFYGTALGSGQLDASAEISGSFLYDPPMGALLPAGADQRLTVAFAPDDTLNYNEVSATATINVLPAPLTIQADDLVRTYGAPNPTLTASYSGFVDGETETALETPSALRTEATEQSPVGAYPIVVEGATAANYAITFVSGTLTVEPVPEFSNVALAGGDRVRLTLAGAPERVYEIHYSTDLRDWRLLAEAQTDSEGRIAFEDPEPVSEVEAARYYRILVP